MSEMDGVEKMKQLSRGRTVPGPHKAAAGPAQDEMVSRRAVLRRAALPCFSPSVGERASEPVPDATKAQTVCEDGAWRRTSGAEYMP